ncbi:MAG: hypothetical protein GX557_07345 [Chloroflexi bacterium]|nr:hypothetical protein [Chloroflexota bacterium]
MNQGRQTGPVNVIQLLVVLASTVSLWLLLGFAGKSLDAYRLRARREELAREVATLEQERSDLQAELVRRQTTPWLEEALRDSGMLPDDVVAVLPLTATPAPATPTPSVEPTATPTAPVESSHMFANPVWRSWRRLIWGGRW